VSADAKAKTASLSRTERREYITGSIAAAVLVLVLVLLFTAISNRGGATAESPDALTLTASYGRADGVFVGTPVRVAGVNVGTVKAASLDADRRAVLTFGIAQAINLPDDTAAIIETDGVFGSKYIELVPGGTEDMLKPGARMSYTQDSVIIEDLIALIVQRAQAARAAVPAEATPETSDSEKPQ
jgi:phospholipid/cholesterol/gamma-HCH transport system substrate-binding protein